jgi:hypothetical protein
MAVLLPELEAMAGHHTKDKGDRGVAKVHADLVAKGYTVLFPATQHAPFDLVAYRNDGSRRLQVKYRSARGALYLLPGHRRVLLLAPGRLSVIRHLEGGTVQERAAGRNTERRRIQSIAIAQLAPTGVNRARDLAAFAVALTA